MKGYLLIFALFALTLSSPIEKTTDLQTGIEEYIEIAKCFLNQTALINDVIEVVDIIKSGDYSKLLTVAFKLYADGQAAVKKCLSKEEENLSIIPDRKCITCYYMCFDEKSKIGKEKALENLQKCLVESRCRLPRTDFRGFPQLEC